jgi:membrane protease subunit HflK
MNPGIGFTWPAPVSRVEMVGVEEIRQVTIPESGSNRENLILTGDQNVIDLAYTVRWNIKNPQLYLFQIREPDQTIREVAETSMRAVVARVSLDDALGAGRSEIEERVEQNMQQLLDDYGSGIQIQGVALNRSQPPTQVNDAFLEVSAAQQKAQSAQNEARAYALQLTAGAQGAAAQFEQIYQQYKAAPEVTRRRMYYETMEEVLSRVDTTIIEAPGVTPYLPLPEIRRGQRPQATPQVQQGQAR